MACVAGGSSWGCSPAAQVNDTPSPQAQASSEAPKNAASNPDATEPGPQDPDAPTDFTTTDSGLKYRVLRKGSGAKATASDRVVVNYKGWLDDGTVFDKSYGQGPFEFGVVGEVIDGWSEGVTYVEEGGMIELEIPSKLGYKENGYPPVIPGNATLHFIIEVIQVQ